MVLAKEFAEAHDLQYIETSAETGAGISEMFQVFAEKGLKICDAITKERELYDKVVRTRKIPPPASSCRIS